MVLSSWPEQAMSSASVEYFSLPAGGKMCCGRTPLETLKDGKILWQDKNLNGRTPKKLVTVSSSLS